MTVPICLCFCWWYKFSWTPRPQVKYRVHHLLHNRILKIKRLNYASWCLLLVFLLHDCSDVSANHRKSSLLIEIWSAHLCSVMNISISLVFPWFIWNIEELDTSVFRLEEIRCGAEVEGAEVRLETPQFPVYVRGHASHLLSAVNLWSEQWNRSSVSSWHSESIAKAHLSVWEQTFMSQDVEMPRTVAWEKRMGSPDVCFVQERAKGRNGCSSSLGTLQSDEF